MRNVIASKQTFFRFFLERRYMIHVLKIHVVQQLSTIKMDYDKLNQGKEGLGLVSRPDGQSFQTWFQLLQSGREHRDQNGV